MMPDPRIKFHVSLSIQNAAQSDIYTNRRAAQVDQNEALMGSMPAYATREERTHGRERANRKATTIRPQCAAFHTRTFS